MLHRRGGAPARDGDGLKGRGWGVGGGAAVHSSATWLALLLLQGGWEVQPSTKLKTVLLCAHDSTTLILHKSKGDSSQLHSQVDPKTRSRWVEQASELVPPSPPPPALRSVATARDAADAAEQQ